MTKSGEPSPIRDIRFFAGSGHGYVEGCHEATAFARRVSLLLRSRGLSFGSWTHLYMRVVERDVADGSLVLSDGAEWWHRFVEVAVPRGFHAMEEGERDRLLIAKTTGVLKSILSGHEAEVEEACSQAMREQAGLRFLIKRKRLPELDIEISVNVATWPGASDLLVVVRDRDLGVDLAAPPITLRLYQDAFSLAGDVKAEGSIIRILPRTSFTAQVTAKPYAASLVIPRSEFRVLEHSSPTSALIVGPL